MTALRHLLERLLGLVNMRTSLTAWTVLLAALSVSTNAQVPRNSTRDLTQASLEDLLDIQVTSVSKKEQKLSHAGAAIFVITQEDIRRSGATNLPEVLRLAPGVSVARINSSTWAISIRGFSNLYGNKVLVVIDGRSVYTPAFSGVYWDQQDLPLEDIERIEIIRGPGGTVWGANAVNGVINIITKSAQATTGGLVTLGTGSENVGDGLVQYGGTVGSKGAYRAFGRYTNTQQSRFGDGTPAGDGWHSSHAGFRSDWQLSQRDTLTVQGDLEQGLEGEPSFLAVPKPLTETETRVTSFSAGHVLGRWNRTLDSGSSLSLQAYVDHYDRWEDVVRERRTTGDLDFQYRQALGSRQDLVWGLGYRTTSGLFSPGPTVSFLPPQRTDNLYSAFVQDEIKVNPLVSLTIGSKFEHNSYTGFEIEPSAQLVWTPTTRQSVWLSASRAIRQPAMSDVTLQVDAAIIPLGEGRTGLLRILGTPNPKTEELRDFEAGYRAQVGRRLSLDADIFLSYYRHLQTAEPQTPYFAVNPLPPHLVIPEVFDYKAHARNYGGEFSVNWAASSRWKLSTGYSLLHMNVTRDPSSGDASVESTPGRDPRHQFQIRSLLNLGRNWEWDNTIAYVGARPSFGVPGFARGETRLGWRPSESVELSVSAHDFLRPSHSEYFDEYQLLHTQVERSVVGKITWHF